MGQARVKTRDQSKQANIIQTGQKKNPKYNKGSKIGRQKHKKYKENMRKTATMKAHSGAR